MATNPVNWSPAMIGGPIQPPAQNSSQGADPYTQFMNWLSGSSASNFAAGDLSGGIGGAQQVVRDATKQAMGQLQPYAQGGLQDYNTYRDMVNSGYFNQPFKGTYQAPTMQTQAFNPTYDKASGTYKNNYTPWQAPQQAPISQPSLPQFTPHPQNYLSAPVPQQGGMPQGGGQGGGNDQLMQMLKSIMQQRNSMPPSAGVPSSPVAGYNSTQTGAPPNPNTAQAATSNPITDYVRQISGRNTGVNSMTMQDILNKIGIGKTGPYGMQGMQGIGGLRGGLV